MYIYIYVCVIYLGNVRHIQCHQYDSLIFQIEANTTDAINITKLIIFGFFNKCEAVGNNPI